MVTKAEHGFIGQLLADLAISGSLQVLLILLLHSPRKLLQPHLQVTGAAVGGAVHSWLVGKEMAVQTHKLADVWPL